MVEAGDVNPEPFYSEDVEFPAGANWCRLRLPVGAFFVVVYSLGFHTEQMVACRFEDKDGKKVGAGWNEHGRQLSAIDWQGIAPAGAEFVAIRRLERAARHVGTQPAFEVTVSFFARADQPLPSLDPPTRGRPPPLRPTIARKPSNFNSNDQALPRGSGAERASIGSGRRTGRSVRGSTKRRRSILDSPAAA